MWKRRSHERPNCWEVKMCGRQPGGENVALLGVCPAVVEDRLDGTHGGKNAGRACWMIAGTFCRGKIQGLHAQKYRTCRECDFYQRVHLKEGVDIAPTGVLPDKLDKILL